MRFNRAHIRDCLYAERLQAEIGPCVRVVTEILGDERLNLAKRGWRDTRVDVAMKEHWQNGDVATKEKTGFI